MSAGIVRSRRSPADEGEEHRAAYDLHEDDPGPDSGRASTSRPLPARRRRPAGPPPRALADLIDIAEQTSGVHLAELIATIEPDQEAVIRALTAILDSAAGQGPDPASFRVQARRFWFERLGGCELASDPDVVSLVNRFRSRLGSQANQNSTPEKG